MSKIVRAAIKVVVLLGVVGFGFYYIRTHESCTVGVTGTSASVTVDGAGANAQCSAIVSGAPSGVGYQYQAGAQPGAAVICQDDIQGDVFTVRDQGAVTAAGRAMCVYLATLH